ncbi:hypothetical protein G5V57_18055 [Nordella sp. HKS 07]|uniref:primase-helicase family protein n=1 Tax=Nordella sp. HKS 07 TaxID=2712222 RepID=UPI0013E1BA8C|nr:primase-helicase family protein [Nordella sp. HKS 07]QIG49452.1 hypothetical protein G5V57_18055 [Nordella sp. HKS 07]
MAKGRDWNDAHLAGVNAREKADARWNRKRRIEDGALRLEDFYAYMPQHRYLFAPTRDLWPGSSVNARIPPVNIGGDKPIPATAWLDQHQPVEQLTWFPGEEMLIRGLLVADGGFIERPGTTIFNLYRPPNCLPGDPRQAGRWLDHVHKVYPDNADHILLWLAHRVQKPFEKINHALLLGGAPGIGKDTILVPLSYAVGSWNMMEVTPVQLLGRFNGFIKSVILRINEARDLGEINRYTFYERCKPLIAAPPDVLRCDEKNIREYSVPNVVGVIITTNYLTDGCYLPSDDRRHYVAWSPLAAGALGTEYFDELYRWYQDGGNRHVAAWLAALDLTGFNPKAPPAKTEAFWSVVDANQGGEEGGLADVIDVMMVNGKPPDVITLEKLALFASAEIGIWIKDPKNRRIVPKLLERVGYLRVANPMADDGRWKIDGKRQTLYGYKNLTPGERIDAARGFLGWREHEP